MQSQIPERAKLSLEKLGDAVVRLEEAIATEPVNKLIIDGTIQRYEFTFEMFWKTFKRLLEFEGIETSTPRESIKEAFAINWIQSEVLWLDMIKSRNLSSHVYDEKIADNVYAKIKEYTPELRKTYDFLIKKFLER